MLDGLVYIQVLETLSEVESHPEVVLHAHGLLENAHCFLLLMPLLIDDGQMDQHLVIKLLFCLDVEVLEPFLDEVDRAHIVAHQHLHLRELHIVLLVGVAAQQKLLIHVLINLVEDFSWALQLLLRHLHEHVALQQRPLRDPCQILLQHDPHHLDKTRRDFMTLLTMLRYCLLCRPLDIHHCFREHHELSRLLRLLQIRNQPFELLLILLLFDLVYDRYIGVIRLLLELSERRLHLRNHLVRHGETDAVQLFVGAVLVHVHLTRHLHDLRGGTGL